MISFKTMTRSFTKAHILESCVCIVSNWGGKKRAYNH